MLSSGSAGPSSSPVPSLWPPEPSGVGSPLQISEAAARQIAEMAARAPRGFLRIMVDSGGCSGFRYQFSLDTALQAEDLVFVEGEAVCVVDAVSWPFLEGASLDHVSTLAASHFTLSNPLARTGCGCGQSFSV